MTEELKEGAAGVEGEATPAPASGEVVQPETTPTTEPVTGESAEVPPEYAELIDKQVKAALDAQRDKYEGEGGDISKLKSKKDKEIARLRKELREQQEADRKRAEALMASGDPEEAAKLYAAQNQSLMEQAYAEQFRAEMTAYVETSMGELGLDLEDDEAAAAAAEWTQRLIEGQQRGQDWSGAFHHEIGKLRVEQKDKQVSQLQKQLDAQTEKMPSLIAQAVAAALDKRGIGRPDLSQDGAAVTGKGDVHGKAPGLNVRDGVAAARAKMKKQEEMRAGMG
jgi:hypothetical protein